MKKLLIFLVLISVLTSCYDDFRLDNEFSSVAFASADGGSDEPGVLWRTVVKGEGLKLNAGIYLAGILDNGKERWADFELDPTLLDGTGYTLLPSDYYSLSNASRFVIPKGEMVGTVEVTLDSINFLEDPLTSQRTYALPFRLMETSEDSILSTQSTQILVVKYMNQYEGFYNQTGSFQTLSADESELLNSGDIENVITASTIVLDSVEMNGSMNLVGPDYKIKMRVNADNTVSLQYSPNLNADNSPKNIALDATVTAPNASPWENKDGIKEGVDPTASNDRGSSGLAFGNWPLFDTWDYVEYDFGGDYLITESNIYWFADSDPGVGGVSKPYNTYLQYWDSESESWNVLYNNNVVNGTEVSEANYFLDDGTYTSENPAPGTLLNQYNTTTFDPVTTSKVRVYFKSVDASGILEWKVWGIQAPSGYESSPIGSIVENGENTYNPETGVFTLNYSVYYALEDYHTNVTTILEWRNRIRDGVNEWRR
ncbi:DUF1735 domain-containing protein [Aestuariibaculum sp. YM273]|uniref:DUF1735 domain-containing protein n=1 Tax=Aestuariibaculum sp. YM273 TaxID=3070659 RepID=UPI0027DCE31A|nr:DUF1735 domain-containing protein [Aestuariibaculum sp. YM273]WMI65211.1 DUF1735 domain-containing protein [Aestuariibaculum sp. YM273]